MSYWLQLLQHIVQSPITIQMVVPAGLYCQWARCDQRRNVSHVEVLPKMGYIITAAITVQAEQ